MINRGRAKRILLVEDETAICVLCQRVLSGEGFEVDIADNEKVVQTIPAQTIHPR